MCRPTGDVQGIGGGHRSASVDIRCHGLEPGQGGRTRKGLNDPEGVGGIDAARAEGWEGPNSVTPSLNGVERKTSIHAAGISIDDCSGAVHQFQWAVGQGRAGGIGVLEVPVEGHWQRSVAIQLVDGVPNDVIEHIVQWNRWGRFSHSNPNHVGRWYNIDKLALRPQGGDHVHGGRWKHGARKHRT